MKDKNMIQGSVKTEKQYRATDLDSSSSLKEFSLDRRKYYKKYVKNENVEEEQSKASIVGQLLETLLFEKDKFDERFYMSSLAKAPTGKMLDFCNALIDITIQNTDEEGNVTKSFEEMAAEARTIAQYDWKLAVILSKFIGSDPEIYYKEVRQVKSKGLIVVTTDDVQNAERIVEELRSNETTAPILNLVNSDRYTILIQYQVEGYEVDGLPLKSMMDLVIIDHKEKTISPYDLKITWNVENFVNDYFMYRRSYIQAYLYKEACYELKKREKLDYYNVENLKFIVADSVNYYLPLIYTLNSDNMDDFYNGFTYNGKFYPGVKTIIEGLKFAKNNNIWGISKENYENKGIVSLLK